MRGGMQDRAPAPEPDQEEQDRSLRRAAWQRFLSLRMAGDPAALEAGRAAVDLVRAQMTRRADPRAIATVATVMATGVAEMIVDFGGPVQESFGLLREADVWCRGYDDPEPMRARAAALHADAELCWRLLGKPGLSSETSAMVLEDLTATATEAVRLRRLLYDPSDRNSRLQLADSLRLLAQGSAVAKRYGQVADVVGEAYDRIRSAPGNLLLDQLREKLAQLVRYLEGVAPAALAAERASGRIPY